MFLSPAFRICDPYLQTTAEPISVCRVCCKVHYFKMSDWDILVRGSVAGGSSSSSDVGRLTTSALPPSAGLVFAEPTAPVSIPTVPSHTDTDTDHALNSIKDILGGSSSSSVSRSQTEVHSHVSAVIANPQPNTAAAVPTNVTDAAAKALQAAAAHFSTLNVLPGSSASPLDSSEVSGSEDSPSGGSSRGGSQGTDTDADSDDEANNTSLMDRSDDQAAPSAQLVDAAVSAASEGGASGAAGGAADRSAGDLSGGDVLPTVYAGIYLSRPQQDGSGLHWLMRGGEAGQGGEELAPAAADGAGAALHRLPTLTAATQAAALALEAEQALDPLRVTAQRLTLESQRHHGTQPLADKMLPQQPVKRKRGRPRKHPLPADQVPAITANDLVLDEPCDRYVERFRRALRGEADLPAAEQCPVYVPEHDAEFEAVQHSAMNEANKALQVATAAAAKEAAAVAGSLTAWTADMLLVGTPSQVQAEEPEAREPTNGSQAPMLSGSLAAATPALESQGMTVELGGGARRWLPQTAPRHAAPCNLQPPWAARRRLQQQHK